jgi:hypothetical protein
MTATVGTRLLPVAPAILAEDEDLMKRMTRAFALATVLLCLSFFGCGARKDRGGNPVEPIPAPPPSTGTPVTPTTPGPSGENPPKEEPGKKATYTREQFRIMVVGKTKDELIRTLGEAESPSRDGDDEYWFYYGRTTNPADGTIDDFAQVVMNKGVVKRVRFKPRDE